MVETQTSLTSKTNSRIAADHVDAVRGWVLAQYPQLLTRVRASHAGKRYGDEAVLDSLHHILFDEFERLLLRYQDKYGASGDLLDYLVKCANYDYRVGIRARWNTLHAVKDPTVPLPVRYDEDGHATGEEASVLPEAEREADPAVAFQRAHDAVLDGDGASSIRQMLFERTEAEIEEELDGVLPKVTEAWAIEDEPTPAGRAARQVVYSQALRSVLGTMRAGKSALTPTGKLRMAPRERMELSRLAGRSDRMVRHYLRDLEKRVTGLVNS